MSTHDWQKSSYSADAGNCLELRWQKSSYSAQAGNCLNIAASPGPAALHLRESDEPATILTTTPARLAALLSSIKTGGRSAAA
jgi:hypothetical protein